MIQKSTAILALETLNMIQKFQVIVASTLQPHKILMQLKQLKTALAEALKNVHSQRVILFKFQIVICI